MTQVQGPLPGGLQRFALVAGILVSIVGAGNLVAWLSGPVTLGATPDAITMKANASVCLTLAGLALSLLALDVRPGAALLLTARLAAAAVLAIAATTLAEHIGQLDLGIDQLLASEPPGARAVVSPNRMGPPASFSFTLLSVGLLLLGRRPRPNESLSWAHQPLAIVALVTVTGPAIGYLYGADELYGIARYTGIAWSTAASLVVLAVGVLYARPNAGVMTLLRPADPGGAFVWRLLLPVVLLPLALGWLRLYGERHDWFGAETGTSLLVMVFIVGFSAMVLVAGRWVSRSHDAVRQSEAAARRQLAEIQAIYDSAHVGLCVLDRDLRYRRINHRLAEINGVPAADHIGRRVDEIVPSLAPLASDIAERIFRTGEGVTDVEFTGTTAARPGIQRTWTEQWLPLQDASGEIVGINVVVEETTERRLAEEIRRQSEERFRALVRASSQVLYRMSADWSEMLELQGGDVIAASGKRNRNWLLEYIHPEDQQRMLDALGEAVRTESVFELEHRVLRVDGTLGWTSSRAVPVRNAAGEIVEWFGAATDITARKRAEGALRQSRNRLTVALEIAALGIWEYDTATALSRHDERCRDIFGLPDDRPLSTDEVLELVHPADRARVAAEVAAALDPSGEGLYDTECRILRRDGTERWVAVRGHAIGLEDESDRKGVRFVGTLMDISSRKRAEEALRAANERLAEADRTKDEFIAILSHELRNPIAPIRYALPLLEREGLGDSGRRAVDVIRRQVNHLTRLVDDVLDVSRITTGKIELRREDVTVESILHAATEAASPAIVAGRHVLTRVPSDEPIWVHVDAGRIAQAITNLLNNSAKYTPTGGQITLTAERDEGHAVIRVRDNGVGLEPDALSTVFEMFRQVSRAGKPQGGLGIGLAFAKRLVELHGGSIEARSGGLGQGAEFVVRLPLGVQAHVGPTDAAVGSAAARRRLKVLVVDDNADFVLMLAAVLEGAGHDVRKALEGRSAISLALSFRPHVVLLDLGMPGMGGLEVAAELRRHPALAHVRLVALTGWGQAHDRRQTQEAGFDLHLTKPTDPEHLQTVLADFAGELPDDGARHRA